MFTGIIRYTGKIRSASSSPSGRRLTIEAPEELISRLEIGITSVALDGACHTVESVEKNAFTVYTSPETLRRTTLGESRTGKSINLELPLTPSGLLDGHLVQGHVDGIGRISSIRAKGESRIYRFETPSEIGKYLVEKDSIAIDGVSLTLFSIDSGSFEVAMIPETIAKTALAKKKEGDAVNLEVNVIAKYFYEFTRGRSSRHWTEAL